MFVAFDVPQSMSVAASIVGQVSDFSPGVRLCKILFGRATGCAFPDCMESLVEEHRGLQSINVEVAHIRAERLGGPRYDPGFTKENGKVNSEPNLMLLCLKHHKRVDDHPDAYPTEELLIWKKRQVEQSQGAGLSAEQLDRVVKAFTTPRAEVEAVGILRAGGGSLISKIEDLGTVRAVNADSEERLLGVRIANVGAVGFDIGAVGVEIDVDGPAPVLYFFPPAPARRVEPHAVAVWMVDVLNDILDVQLPEGRREPQGNVVWSANPLSIAAGLRQGVIPKGWMPVRFRAFGNLGPGARVLGPWVSALHLPIWEDHVTQEWLDGMAAMAAQARAQFRGDV
ncbi:hypothetical protein ACFYYS_00485 [Streptomyces sp. NPDC002120]|uniref:hypothetical protein n=1 Tax=Streptomyces sp. NPDC002120 TaxID=3364631 RepID=UPI003677C855